MRLLTKDYAEVRQFTKKCSLSSFYMSLSYTKRESYLHVQRYTYILVICSLKRSYHYQMLFTQSEVPEYL